MRARKQHNELLRCASAADSCSETCNGCSSNRIDGSPFGVSIIAGSGKLSEFPLSNDSLNCPEEGSTLLECIRNADICPKAFPPTTICVRECPEFSSLSQTNFINGDLVIAAPLLTSFANIGTLQVLPPPSNDLIDIFPNLLGINGSLYIVGTPYRNITGFEKLRFVTGSIVIVNNPNLIVIPEFASLLSVGGQVVFVSNNSSPTELAIAQADPVTEKCGRSAIIIANNASLRKIRSFEAIRQVEDGIFIADNSCLTHICGFVHLYRSDRIVIARNPILSRIVGFCMLDTVNIGLYILDNNLDGQGDLIINAFDALETAGRIVVVGNNSLGFLKFKSLRNVLNEFIVRSNNSLTELYTSLQATGDLYVENNRSLHSLRVPCLFEVNFNISISANCSLQCLDTFDELKRVGGSIQIADNKQLIEIKGFNNLKYVGEQCTERPLFQLPNSCQGCGCNADVAFDFTSIIVLPDCTIIDDFPVNFYDNSVNACAYVLPIEFYRQLCNAVTPCGEVVVDEEIPDVVNFSILIFRNPRLKAIGGFCNLKHISSSLYIIGNIVLHTINAFGQLAYALDIWIRNNSSLKYIIGFANLLAIRDFVVLESLSLLDLNGLKSLEFAQDIAIEAKSVRSVKFGCNPIPSVFGYILYYSYEGKC